MVLFKISPQKNRPSSLLEDGRFILITFDIFWWMDFVEEYAGGNADVEVFYAVFDGRAPFARILRFGLVVASAS